MKSDVSEFENDKTELRNLTFLFIQLYESDAIYNYSTAVQVYKV